MLIFQTLLQQDTFIQHTGHLQLINSIDKKQQNSNFHSRVKTYVATLRLVL